MADLSPELAAKIQTLEGGYADNPGRYFVALAGAWREAGEIGRAEEILRENLKRFPGLSAHVLLGRCLADRGAVQEAANEFHYVLSIDAQNLIALRTLAEMAAAGGRRGEAERWYNELLAVDPMNAEARAALAQLARAGGGAHPADAPAQADTGWRGGGEPAPAANPAGADGGEFGMIDLGAPDASPADASGVAADDEGEWGDLPLDMGDEPQPADASAPAGDFDAFGFGSVDLDAPADDADPWLAGEARQDLGATAAADLGDFGSPEDDTLLDAPAAGADLPFLDTGHAVPADDLPLLDADAATEFGGFGAPPHADLAALAPAGPGAGLPPMDHGADDHPVDHEVDAEVVTETMAELYAAQGLLQQSADTYRELIRQRGEEPGLVRRLAEIQARLHPAAEPGATEPLAEAPAAGETPDWLASVDEFAMGGAAAGLAAIHMSAEQPDAEPEASDDGLAPPASADGFAPLASDDGFAPLASDDDVEEPAHALAPADVSDTVFDAVANAGSGLDAAEPVAGLDYLTPADVAAATGADAFADSFRGGFEGAEAPAPENALAAPADELGAGDGRGAWEAPAVRETEPVGFDLIVVEEGGEEVPAPPEVVADVSADWAMAAAPLEDDEEAAGQVAAAAPAGAATMRAYFTGLLSWQPGPVASAPAALDEPAYAPPAVDAPLAAVEDEEWGGPPAPRVADEPWDAAPPVADEPWDPVPADDAGQPQDAVQAGDAGLPRDAAPAAPQAEPAVPDDEPWSAAPAREAAPPQPADEPWAAAADPAAAESTAGDEDLPLMELDEEPWSAAGAPEPAGIDSFTLADDAAPAGGPAAAGTGDEALPWELPVQPAASAPPAAPESDGGFSFEDFFAGSGPAASAPPPPAPEPEPEPLRGPETPAFVPSLAFEPAPEPAPAAQTPAPAAPPAGGQDEEDEDLESFQAWLQSLKR